MNVINRALRGSPRQAGKLFSLVGLLQPSMRGAFRSSVSRPVVCLGGFPRGSTRYVGLGNELGCSTEAEAEDPPFHFCVSLSGLQI